METTGSIPAGTGPVDRFRELFDAIDEGYCLCEMLVDEEGRAVDYRFLEVNRLFEEMTGLRDPVGRTALELVPDLERHWIDTYAKVALDGELLRFEQGSEAMGRWFDVFSMPLGGERRFAVVFKDDTARRQVELELQRSEAKFRDIAERERRISLRLQQALLPDTLADHPQLVIETHYSASDALLDVGGDWYDTIAWPDGHVAVVVGDVVGHDLEAAATMGRLRSATKAVAVANQPDPVEVLTALARCARGPEGTELVTACVAVFDPDGSRLRYASGGHPPALLVGPSGDSTWLDTADNAALGRTIDLNPERAVQLDFPPGSTLLMYTDGLVERPDRPIDDGFGALRSLVAAEGPAGLAPESITERLSELGEPQDDVIVVRIRRP